MVRLRAPEQRLFMSKKTKQFYKGERKKRIEQLTESCGLPVCMAELLLTELRTSNDPKRDEVLINRAQLLELF